MQSTIPIPVSAPFLAYPNRPSKLTPEFVREQYVRILEAARVAEKSDSSAEWEKAVLAWNELKAYVSGEYSRASYAFTQDTANAAKEAAEKSIREHISPVAETLGFEFTTLILESRHRPGLEKRFGSYLFERLQASRETTAPINVELRVQDGNLAQQYSKIVASGQVELRGSSYTLARAQAFAESSDADLRKEAFEKYRGWFVSQRGRLAPIFSEMVSIRDQMGRNLGHSGYIPLGYASMERTDYGRSEVDVFRRALRESVVPLVARLRERQAHELGTETLKPWDASFQPSLHMPQGLVPVSNQLERAQVLFDRLSPRLGSHFKRMRDEQLIDLENRPGKQAGAYCTSFLDEGRPAIFCNSTGSFQDIGTLTHEMGHAFQSWESQAIEIVDLRWPTLDACEIHSMGMEYLSLRHMDVFFDPEHARRFQLLRWKHSLELLCHVAVVDEFQHWVYENPKASQEERDRAWCRIFDLYQQGWDFSGCEEFKWARWYAQGHIFKAPFYYIDYAIAETGAMQLALMDSRDSKQAIESYLELCKLGGTRSVLKIFDSAGMRSPFDPELVRDLAALAEGEVGIA